MSRVLEFLCGGGVCSAQNICLGKSTSEVKAFGVGLKPGFYVLTQKEPFFSFETEQPLSWQYLVIRVAP